MIGFVLWLGASHGSRFGVAFSIVNLLPVDLLIDAGSNAGPW